MADYINAPIVVEPEDLLQTVIDYLQAQIPGWTPADGNLDVWLAEAFTQVAAQVAETAADVPATIFRWYGAKVANLPPDEATQATGSTTWTVVDDAGYTIPAGTTIGVDSDGTLIGFQTVDDAVIPAGSTSVVGVAVIASEAGSTGTGLSGAATLIDALDFVVDVTFDAATIGGQDAETDDVYLDRLADELRLLAPRPILPADFATLALRTDGVGRALAIDGYNPADGTYSNERMVTVAVADASGEPVSSAAKASVDATLQGEREVTFIVNVIDPTYTTVDVTFAATMWPGFDAAAVQANAIAAVTDYLSPSTWGQPNFGETRSWQLEDKARYLEVATVLNGVEGLRHVTSLTLGVGGGSQSAADVTLAGAAPMPRAGAISGTVS